MATPNTDYNKYTNDELKQMIDELVKNNMMEIDLLGKLHKALFNDDDILITKDDEPLKAEKRHQIYNHYKYKLIKIYNEYLHYRDIIKEIITIIDSLEYEVMEGILSKEQDEEIKKCYKKLALIRELIYM